MAVSQFTIYSSSDGSGPGPIQGVAGDLLRVLDACLVNGYLGKTAAGWSKPLANSSNCGCYRNGAGSTQLNLHINDNGPHGSTTYRETYAVGWETISAVGGTTGVGTGQFPLTFNTAGVCSWRKSDTANTTPRSWIVAADAHTMYMWVDVASNNVYSHHAFGDIYSLKPTTDTYRCMIYGWGVGNTQTYLTGEWSDCIVMPENGQWGVTNINWDGHFLARSWGGGGGAVKFNKVGDASVSYPFNASYRQYGHQMGNQTFGPDNKAYMAPFRVFEQASGQYRGRLRGLYMPCHYYTLYSNGQTFSGAGDYAGKEFMAIRQGGNAGVWLLEISNTVETN